MEQWHVLKKQAGPAILLFRLGDFYEAFFDDAERLADTLGLTLTKRHDTPMAGIPYHSLDGYLDKLIDQGHMVAIAEQTENPKDVKGIVKRAIVRTVSPGTTLNLKEAKSNFFACLFRLNSWYGLTLLDLSTGELRLLEVENTSLLFDELARTKPSEILISEKCNFDGLLDELKHHFSFRITLKAPHLFDHRLTLSFLLDHFNVHSLDGFGLKGSIASINATGALLSYVRGELCLSISHIKKLTKVSLDNYQAVDATTMRHLEIHELFKALDFTSTPMGGRLLKDWFDHPLLSVMAIEERQKCVKALCTPLGLTVPLKKIRDLNRLCTRISMGFAKPRDLLALALSLEQVPLIQEITTSLDILGLSFQDTSQVFKEIRRVLIEEPSHFLIAKGVDEALDELKALKVNSEAYLASYQTKLRDELNIKTLKVAFNRAFGFYIEIPRSQAEKMPEAFQRRQTLVNNERYITDELKDYEIKILTAEEKINAIEAALFDKLLSFVKAHEKSILINSAYLAKLDSYLSLALASKKYNYACPVLTSEDMITIIDGRHPLLDTPSFVPNNTYFDDKERLAILTGPNMAGKSTYLRQVALITYLAHIGSFVPAKEATIGLTDKIFSRIGASDDLKRGQSTFMVEMVETANILNNATTRSLVILDEIGRGTSTYDGIAIAWAVALSLKNTKTLFATHYSELTELEKLSPLIQNYSVAVEENQDGIVFLHKIMRGGTDKSYGIHVARLAGLPNSTIKCALSRLQDLENQGLNQKATFIQEEPGGESKLTKALDAIEPNQITPIEALQRLIELKALL